MLESFWVLMYVIVTWNDSGLSAGKQYDPRVMEMPSKTVCIRTKLEMAEQNTPTRAYMGVRCEELHRWIELSPD